MYFSGEIELKYYICDRISEMGTKIRSLKRPHPDRATEAGEEEGEVPLTRRSEDEPVVKASKWTNKTRVLVLAARNINFRGRHLMSDIKVSIVSFLSNLHVYIDYLAGHDAARKI